MDIRLLDSNNEIILTFKNVNNPEELFQSTWKETFGADRWEIITPMSVVKSVSILVDEALRDVDSAAGKVRAKYITISPGQDATYVEKGNEAERYKLAGYPADLTSYPWIAAEVAGTGLNAQDATDAILAKKAFWAATGSMIEKERLAGKKALSLLLENPLATSDDVLSTKNAALMALNGI